MSQETPVPAAAAAAPKTPRVRRTPGERAQVRLAEAHGRLDRANDASKVADQRLTDAQAAKKAADVEVRAAEKALKWAGDHPDLPRTTVTTSRGTVAAGGAS